jgi:lactoylglutathione lyase
MHGLDHTEPFASQEQLAPERGAVELAGTEGHGAIVGATERRRQLRAWYNDRMTEPVREMRLVVTADDYEAAVRFYRDVLGMPERASFSSADGQVVILEAGRATLEIADPGQAAFIDQVEVGRRVAGHIRVAFEVADSVETTQALAAAGATVIAGPTRTPWGTLNARLEGPAGLQLTLFADAPPEASSE